MKILSRGQSGVDRAALDVALDQGLSCGGWCPRGRWAEDGPIASRYPLEETPSRRPQERTRWNVRDSDALLIIEGGASPGTRLALETARLLERPHLVVEAGDSDSASRVSGWLARTSPKVLNVAGPRESECPGIYFRTRELLRRVLADREEFV